MHRGHEHDHGGGHSHGRPNDVDHPRAHAPAGHNHPGRQDLHSHPHGGAAEERHALQALTDAFIEGFRKAEDKTSYLRLAEVPFSVPGEDGLARRLVDVTVTSGWQVATASPGFASRDLVWLPFPGEMVRERTTLTFVYVSLTGRTDIDLVDFLAHRFEGAGNP